MDATPFRRPVVMAESPPITSLARAVLAQCHAAIERGVRASDYAAATWPTDAAVPLLLRAASSPTTVANTATLMPIRQAFVEALRPITAAGELFAAGLTLTTFGRGTVTVPGFAPGESQFVAEAGAIPVEQFTASGPTLTPYKLATITALSAELIEHSEAERIVRSALTESAAIGLDKALFSNAASVAGLRPPGLLNGIAPLTPAGAGAGAMNADLTALLAAIAPVAGAGFMIVAAPAQAATIQFGLVGERPSVRASAGLPAKTVIAIATQAFAGVLETPRVEASSDAVLHMEDTNPTEIGNTSAPTRSLWQTNSIGLRMIMPVSWGLRSPTGVAWMSAVNW